MKNRIRFSKQRITNSFRKGFARPRVANPVAQILIDPDLLDGLAAKDQEAIDEIVKEMDEALGEILDNLEKKEKEKLKAKVSDGEKCIKCDNFYPYAEPNQPNGTLICYNCRQFG